MNTCPKCNANNCLESTGMNVVAKSDGQTAFKQRKYIPTTTTIVVQCARCGNRCFADAVFGQQELQNVRESL